MNISSESLVLSLKERTVVAHATVRSLSRTVGSLQQATTALSPESLGVLTDIAQELHQAASLLVDTTTALLFMQKQTHSFIPTATSVRTALFTSPADRANGASVSSMERVSPALFGEGQR